MVSFRERRQADLFYADLMGLARPPARRRSPAGAPRFSEDAPTKWPGRKGRVVFYDRNTLRFIEGWTRDTTTDRVFLIDRSEFDRVRADGRRRARELDEHIRRHMAGQRNVGLPLYLMDDRLHTVPLVPRAGDWDDLMIEMLIDAARPLVIEPLAQQERMIDRLFGLAKQDALNAASRGVRGVSAQEFVAFLLLDNVTARLTMVQAANVTMDGNHARIALDVRRGNTTTFRVVPGDPNGPIVIGDIHTHMLVDPLIDRSSTRTGTTDGPRRTVHSGVSPVDVTSARSDQIVVYAVDSKRLHRVSPDGTITDGIVRPHNVLREALRIFGGEPVGP
jgi:hypothetical protein